ncbi:MAG TPA: TIGR03619 family F420-dependent LLM class oxidoreductase [Ilumatobacter sp.]|nr:TIGR03619 family F420-dependent LLM class oxidoreductase [Ilumatobacter sp.]
MTRSPTLTLLLRNFSNRPRDWGDLFERSRAADEAGIDRVLVSDHVVLGEHLDAYENGRFLTPSDGQWLEPMTVIAMVAATTKRVRVGTGVILAALRRPVVLAKTAATLDVLSGGRLDLGVGTGWQREEYGAAGLDFARRGQLLDQTLEVCRLLWADGPASYEGDGLAFERIWCEPKPIQPGGVPIWVAGRPRGAVLRRIVRFADGWIPWAEWNDDVAVGIAVLRRAFAEAGRPWDGFQVRVAMPVSQRADGVIDVEATMAPVPALVSAGVTDFTVHVELPSGDIAAARDRLSGLVEAFNATTGRST